MIFPLSGESQVSESQRRLQEGLGDWVEIFNHGMIQYVHTSSYIVWFVWFRNVVLCANFKRHCDEAGRWCNHPLTPQDVSVRALVDTGSTDVDSKPAN